MHETLTKLVSELQKETCPRRVLAELKPWKKVRQPAPTRIRLAISALAAIAVLLCGLSLWRWHGARTTGTETRLPAAQPGDREDIARQTAAALEFVGATLVDAGQRSEKAILTQAVPPLRNSLETASKKTINRLKL